MRRTRNRLDDQRGIVGTLTDAPCRNRVSPFALQILIALDEPHPRRGHRMAQFDVGEMLEVFGDVHGERVPLAAAVELLAVRMNPAGPPGCSTAKPAPLFSGSGSRPSTDRSTRSMPCASFGAVFELQYYPDRSLFAKRQGGHLTPQRAVPTIRVGTDCVPRGHHRRGYYDD
jgi:hypothetical protein